MKNFLLFFLFLFPMALLAMPIEAEKKMAAEGVELLLARRYEESEIFVRKILKKEPDSLLAPLGLMVIAQMRNFENFDLRFQEKYHPWDETGKGIATQRTDLSRPDPWSLFLAGSVFGISGLVKVTEGNILKGYWEGRLAVQAFEKAQALAPAEADPLLGIGFYDFWQSHFMGIFRHLPFFPDRRKEGIQAIQKVQREGSAFLQPLAEIALAFIYFQQKQYNEVLQITGKFLEKYPENVILLMLQGRAYLEVGQFSKARDDFEKILSRDPKITKAYFFLGVLTAEEGKDRAQAAAYLERFLKEEPEARKKWKIPAREILKGL